MTPDTNSPIPVVHVGCGRAGMNWIKAIVANQKLQLVGLVDLNAEMRRTARTACDLDDSVTDDADLAQMIHSTNARLVTNASSSRAHFATTSVALQSRAHVLCEKPLTEDIAQARKLIALADKAGRWLGVIQNRRVCDDTVTVRRLLNENAIGELLAVQGVFRHPVNENDVVRANSPHVLLLDMGIHHLDLVRYLVRSEAQQVYADDWRPADCAWKSGPAADVLVRFANGVRLNYRAWYGGLKLESDTTDFQGRWTLYGTNGSIHWHGTDIRVNTPDGTRTIPVVGNCPNATIGRAWLIDDMADAILDQRPPAVTAADHLRSLDLVMAAITSSETGRAITLSGEDINESL
jgi:predicted dehydrogenase